MEMMRSDATCSSQRKLCVLRENAVMAPVNVPQNTKPPPALGVDAMNPEDGATMR
jgi:hypothetical protein